MTSQRLSIHRVAPEAQKAVFPLQKFSTAGTVPAAILTLVDIRASQINGCAWCLDMHAAEARKEGVPQRTIDLVAAWREAHGVFDARERAALAFTEEVTLVSEHGVSDAVWSEVRAVFDEAETVQLLMKIATINVWNRMNVAARTALPHTDEA